MKLTKLTTNDFLLGGYNAKIKELADKYPGLFQDMFISSLDDKYYPYAKAITEIANDIPDEENVDFTGIYCTCNFGRIGDSIINEKTKDEFYIFDKFGIVPWGVADNASQVIEHFKQLEKENKIDFGPCVLMMTPLFKETCEDWRWCKWGEYIGKQNPHHEYLRDEEDINIVWVYHLYAIDN